MLQKIASNMDTVTVDCGTIFFRATQGFACRICDVLIF